MGWRMLNFSNPSPKLFAKFDSLVATLVSTSFPKTTRWPARPRRFARLGSGIYRMAFRMVAWLVVGLMDVGKRWDFIDSCCVTVLGGPRAVGLA